MSETTTPKPRMLRGDEAELFRQHDAALKAAVRHFVHNVPDALIEDACSYAWLQLMRHQPQRGPSLFAWLRTTAVHEAWAHCRRDRRAGHLELVPDWHDRLAGDTLHETVAARDALRTLAELPPAPRQCLTLIVSGHSYADVIRLTGRSYTGVNKQLVKARRRIRDQRHDDIT